MVFASMDAEIGPTLQKMESGNFKPSGFSRILHKGELKYCLYLKHKM